MWLEALVWILRGVLVLVCLLMVFVILMQRSKQEGIGAAFGAGMTESVFGADTGNILSKTTVWCAVLFFAITLTLSAISANKYRKGAAGLSQVAHDAAKAMAPPPGAVTNAPAATTNAPVTLTNAPAPKTNVPAPTSKAPATNAPKAPAAPSAKTNPPANPPKAPQPAPAPAPATP